MFTSSSRRTQAPLTRRARAPQVCAEPGCVNDKPCPEHAPKPWAGSTRRRRLPPDWTKRRAHILRRDRHTCQIRGPKCTRVATEVDHRIPNDDHRYSNLQAACPTCHQQKTLAEARAARTRKARR